MPDLIRLLRIKDRSYENPEFKWNTSCQYLAAAVRNKATHVLPQNINEYMNNASENVKLCIMFCNSCN